MVKHNAVYLGDVCKGKKAIRKEAEKHWQYYTTDKVFLNDMCKAEDESNKSGKKTGQYFMSFRGKFMNRDAQATLIFYEHRLYDAQIMFDDLEPLKARHLYSCLFDKLTSQYGHPNNTNKLDNGVLISWYGNRTDIILSHGAVKALLPLVGTLIDFSDKKTEDEVKEQNLK